jgi:quinol monooxygenase YgiN
MKVKSTLNSLKSCLVCGVIAITVLPAAVYSQQKQMVRLAKIVVDSAHLEDYKRILKEEAEASVKLEPGVITLYAVSENGNPTHFTILEIYADSTAYRAHLQTPHFIKYKTGTKHMVKSLDLIETTPLIPGMKIKEFHHKTQEK